MPENTFNKNKDEIFELTADLLARSIWQILKEKEYVILGVPGGRSIAGVLASLRKKEIPWSKVHIFLSDEKVHQHSLIIQDVE